MAPFQRKRYFNTKKVRLKLERLSLCCRHYIRFQYQKGAIKTYLGRVIKPPAREYFNTKKVRLKLAFRRPRARVSSAFQYQKGAIKTVAALNDCIVVLKFQYQKGAIKTSLSLIGGRLRDLISIPKRCD